MKKSTDIRTLKNLNKPVRYSIPDSRGLHLWVRSDGKKYWVYRYTFDGTRFDMGLGSFPDISLADVRITHQRLRGLLLNGVNPSDEKRTRRAEKSTQKKSIKFSKFAFDYIERMSPKWTNRAHEAQWVATVPVSESTWWARVKAGRFPAEVDWQTHHMLKRIRFTQINEWLHISASIGNSTM